jgi:16S rRNA (guanine(966)-N(2))-methyltransferase RsmD
MRERAFAVLGDRVRGSRVLDLWAGTGAVGLEALSRGARSVVFVERHRAAARLIEENSATFDLTSNRAQLIVRPAVAAVKQLIRRGDSFDLVWADPPFADWQRGLELISELFESGLVRAGCLACLECPARADVESVLSANLKISRDLTGGASRVVMIEVADR